MAQSKGNGQAAVAAKTETVDEIVQRFTRQHTDGKTLRERFVYADNSVRLGIGQFGNVAAHYEPASIDSRRAELAMALAIAQRGLANTGDEDYSKCVAAAESHFNNGGALRQSLLECAVDQYLYRFNSTKLSDRQPGADGRPIVLTDNNGNAMTSAESRVPLVNAILSMSASAVVGKGLPGAGQPWHNVITAELRAMLREVNPDNKLKAKEDKPSTGGKRGRQASATSSIFAALG